MDPYYLEPSSSHQFFPDWLGATSILLSTLICVSSMDPLTAFKQEHSAILNELYAMDRQLGSIESRGDSESPKILVSLSHKCAHLSEGLSNHFKREEAALYPILEKRLGPNTESVRQMRREHRELLGRLEDLKSEISRMVEQKDSVRTWDLASRLQDLRGTLSDHVSREEMVLFWLAELRLSNTDRRHVLFKLTSMSPTVARSIHRSNSSWSSPLSRS